MIGRPLRGQPKSEMEVDSVKLLKGGEMRLKLHLTYKATKSFTKDKIHNVKHTITIHVLHKALDLLTPSLTNAHDSTNSNN